MRVLLFDFVSFHLSFVDYERERRGKTEEEKMRWTVDNATEIKGEKERKRGATRNALSREGTCPCECERAISRAWKSMGVWKSCVRACLAFHGTLTLEACGVRWPCCYHLLFICNRPRSVACLETTTQTNARLLNDNTGFRVSAWTLRSKYDLSLGFSLNLSLFSLLRSLSLIDTTCFCLLEYAFVFVCGLRVGYSC